MNELRSKLNGNTKIELDKAYSDLANIIESNKEAQALLVEHLDSCIVYCTSNCTEFRTDIRTAITLNNVVSIELANKTCDVIKLKKYSLEKAKELYVKQPDISAELVTKINEAIHGYDALLDLHKQVNNDSSKMVLILQGLAVAAFICLIAGVAFKYLSSSSIMPESNGQIIKFTVSLLPVVEMGR